MINERQSLETQSRRAPTAANQGVIKLTGVSRQRGRERRYLRHYFCTARL